MRNYWIRILAGAVGIFAIGMALITGFRAMKSKVTTTFNSTDPIPIPLVGLLPFRLDDAKLGSLSRVEFLRHDPEHLSGVRVLVKLADSVGPDRLRACVLVVDDVERINDRTTFRCAPIGAIPAGAEEFGTVRVQGMPDSFPLFLPTKVVADLRRTEIRLDHNGLHVNSIPDPVHAAMEAKADSLREALGDRIEARSDSVDDLRSRADELEDSSASLGAAQRRVVERQADSARTAMRAMIDRMKADEARLGAVERMGEFSPEQVDSLARMGRRIADSVLGEVARQLQQARLQVEGQGAAATGTGAPAVPRVSVEAPPPPPRP
ncbi:MAG: hypothetical protein IPL76_17475 [Gemmatimonadetes bacterium]|nr:hypothetical protein [Gemmatimonadota bacterium]